MILKKLKKEDSLTKFDFLRKEVLNLIPNFSKLNELPILRDSVVKNSSQTFISEKIDIRELDYYFTNSISRASKTMSECRQIKQKLQNRSRKLMIEYLHVLGQEIYKIIFLLVPILVSVAMIVWLIEEYGGWYKKEKDNVVGPFGLFKH